MSRERRFALLLLALLAPLAPSIAAEPAARFTLRSAQVEPAPPAGARFRAKARLAHAPVAGELRERGSFILLGRLAKGGASCGFGALLHDGFEDAAL